MSKDLIRATLGRSPDKLDAVVMGLAKGIRGLRHFATVVRVLI